MTDSSDDSECFESADEGLSDECDIRSDNESRNSPFVDDNYEASSLTSADKSNLEEHIDSAKGSLQYRKRPERGKSSPKPGQTNPQHPGNTRKTSLNDQIFKTDIIKPDVLIQDITSNLSRNINKGFSTIQQTSNSIKGLVMSSIPRTPAKKPLDRFSYDDRAEDLTHHTSASEDSDNNNDDVDDQINNSTLPGPTGFDVTMTAESKKLSNDSDAESIGKSRVDTGKAESAPCPLYNDNESNICLQADANCRTQLSFTEEAIEEGTEIQNTLKTDNICKLVEELKMVFEPKEVHDKEDDEKVEGNTKESYEASIKQDTLDNVESAISNMEFNINKKLEKDPLQSENNSLIVVEDMKKDELDVYNVKDGWDSSELDLDDMEIENSAPYQSGADVPILKSTVPQTIDHSFATKENKVEAGQDGASDDNEGWDDFDIDDEDIDQVVKSKGNTMMSIGNLNSTYSQNSLNNIQQIKPLQPNNITGQTNNDFDQGSFNNNFQNDIKWSGWDKFGEKDENKSKSGWSLGSWGVNALLNTATSVTREISNVLEAGLGAPDPETLARMEMHAKGDGNNCQDKPGSLMSGENFHSTSAKDNDNSTAGGGLNLFPSFGISNLVAGVTNKIVEHSKVHEIGSKVISGGLDTLESFGKKTMEVLQDGDPGLKKKRALLLGSDKPVLSQVLRDAKAKAEIEDKRLEERKMAKMCHFETLFDDFQGLIHLEALEMLSRQCELKLEQMRASLSMKEADDFIGILDEVKELCVIDEDEIKSSCSTMVDFKSSINEAVEPLKNEISIRKIVQVYDEFEEWMRNEENTKKSCNNLFQKAMSTLAELTAITVQQFHKGGELLSIKEHRKTVEEADALLQMTYFLCCEVNEITDKFLKLHTSLQRSERDAEMVKKMKEEAGNAISYIKDAFNLLIPVLQLGAAS